MPIAAALIAANFWICVILTIYSLVSSVIILNIRPSFKGLQSLLLARGLVLQNNLSTLPNRLHADNFVL